MQSVLSAPPISVINFLFLLIIFILTAHLAALKFCFKTCVAMKFVDDDDDDDYIHRLAAQLFFVYYEN